MDNKIAENVDSIGQLIRKGRLEAGLSQEKLLDGQYSKSYLSRVEQDQILPSKGFLDFLKQRLNLNLYTIFEGEEFNEAEVEGVNSSARITPQLSRDEQELELRNLQVTLKAKDLRQAQASLDKFDAEEIHSSLKPFYYYLRGEYYLDKGEPKTALIDYRTALDLYKPNSKVLTLEIERVWNGIGLSYYHQSNFLLAIEYHRKCWQTIQDKKIDDQFFRMQIYYNLANDYFCLNETEQALQLYKEAAALAEKVKNLTDLAGIYWGIALTHRAKGNLPLTKLFLDRSANLYQEIDNMKMVGEVQSILGLALLDNHEFEPAQTALNRALAIAHLFDDTLSEARAHVNLGYLFLENGELAQAKTQAELGVKTSRLADDKLVLGQALAQLGDVYFAEGQAEQCLKFYEEGRQLLEETGAREYLKKFYPRFAKALEKMGKLAEAIEMYHKMIENN